MRGQEYVSWMCWIIFIRMGKVWAMWCATPTHLFKEQKDLHPPILFQPSLEFKNYWRKMNIRSIKSCTPTFLFEEQKDVKPLFLFIKVWFIVFYSEDKISSNMACVSHSLIRWAEGCTSPSHVFNRSLLRKRFKCNN